MKQWVFVLAFLSSASYAADQAEAATGQGFVNDRMYLWNNNVQGCLSKPTPRCLLVKPNKAEYVLYRQNTGKLLLIPTILMSGVEAYYANATKTFLPNYWHDAAQQARQYLKRQSNEWLGVAVNSANIRSQDQLHFHLCELDPTAADPVAAAAQKITQLNVWQPTTFMFKGNTYHIRKSSSLANYPPFQVTFDSGPNSASSRFKAVTNMAAAIAPNNQVYLLYNTDPTGAAEKLLAKSCH